MDFGGLFTVSFDWINQILSGLGNVLLSLVQYLLGEVWQLILWLVSLLPALPSFPLALSAVSVAFAGVFQETHIVKVLQAWNYYIALNLAIVLSTTTLIAEGVASGWHVLRWLLSKLPFIGGTE